ncbi:hypothetical protein MUK71_01065 [Arthrobacter zhangbolii]|uniref:Uncharacterized protein n=1 Tax=Arthrobacter zhangbolii TaxID=2886936 RepID=A0A9X1MBP8_9MICC|nr:MULTISPECIES: hypothetical protein [Arthrobacter]MCC3274192.1 hypothetical protein [Arthrobacter zhangbolii]MCC3296094.1 hypothetical protein [Arthrobacter zhangbolii]MDN3902887.1 hypothetical protein [Arthrobacter sp. YD2]UON92282.1 hypothetical protein MUK71_01065 [Arthrobacter zhangbolii]
MVEKESFVSRFMRATGKVRLIFGPAQQGSLDHPMTEENKALLKSQQEQEKAMWETVTRADGSSYIVSRKPE